MICDKWLHIYGNKLGTGVNCEWVDDVRENVKGQWLDYYDNPIKSYFDGRYSAHCSVCGYHPEYEEEMHSANFCPNCGADMRGDNK